VASIKALTEVIKTARFHREFTNPKAIVKDLYQFIKYYDEGREGLGVSQMWGFCPRKLDLDVVYPRGATKAKVPRWELSAMAGTEMHNLFQNVILAFTGKIWGTWHCYGCNRHVLDSFLPEPVDEEEHVHNWIFQEKEVLVKELGDLPGHLDGHIFITGVKCIFDIKTVNQRGWDKLLRDGPRDKDIYQLCLYLAAEKLTYWCILYYNRNTSELLMVTGKYDPGCLEDSKHKLDVEKKQVILRKKHGDKFCQISERICDSPKDNKAYFCSQKSLCFDDTRLNERLRKRKK